jgi:hypothetical protein
MKKMVERDFEKEDTNKLECSKIKKVEIKKQASKRKKKKRLPEPCAPANTTLTTHRHASQLLWFICKESPQKACVWKTWSPAGRSNH